MTNFFNKSKKPYFGDIFGLFCPNLALAVFKYSNQYTIAQKSEKTNDPFLRKTVNQRADRQTNKKGDFIGPSLGQWSNKNVEPVEPV